MDELKELTKAFMGIQAKYDGGRSYTWKQARSDLQSLEHRTNALRNRARAEWIRHIARLLHKEVRDEYDRIDLIVWKDGQGVQK